MGMNIFVGKAAGNYFSKDNIILTYELQNYLYKQHNHNTEDELLYSLDPYEVTILKKDDIIKIIAVSNYYLSDGRLDDFEEIYDKEGDYNEDNPFDVTFFFRKLLEFCEIALKENLNIVVVGD